VGFEEMKTDMLNGGCVVYETDGKIVGLRTWRKPKSWKVTPKLAPLSLDKYQALGFELDELAFAVGIVVDKSYQKRGIGEQL
jgi:hypothetical protein